MRTKLWMALLLGGGLLLGGCAWLFPPLEATLIAQPTSGVAPLTVTFTLGANKQITSFTLATPGANVALQTGSSLPATVVRVYPEPGTYVATLTVYEGTRTASAQVSIEVQEAPPAPPQILSFSAPQTASQGVEVSFSFTARAGGAGHKLVEYRLWFGDGTLYSEPVHVPYPQTLSRTVTKTYEQTGSYTATLRVYDERYEWTEEKRTLVVE